MKKEIFNTGERVSPDAMNNFAQLINFKKHFFAYSSVQQFIKHKEASILEVGFGEGYGTAFLGKEGFFVTAVDIDQNLCKYAKEKYNSMKNISFITAQANILDFPNNSFDTVISFQVIEHTEDLTQFLSEIHRVLKKGGLFICTTPNRLLRLSKHQKPWNQYHVQEFKAIDLQKKMLSLFSDVAVYGVFGSKKMHKFHYANMYYLRKKNIGELFNPYFYSFTLCRIMKKIGLSNSNYVSYNNKQIEKEEFYLKNKKIDKSLDVFIVSKK